ncbi:MAG: MBL fold metallo-hydrolase [Candidatus Schekmanbacteria bacterium RIFCSPHIGHO2_02_FULL_38_11]|uniref:MBL fold metallo-hydrolase n=1 Tax=Candidatus Schekmanbacteria bacterium RIFCSPLOWO2_12_FULL_38_15 TaxID=1817883 RepID=A0A1F7SMA7_9BACT|nr:MAG: MBL fold metallo-hydrolase [Candidatus Schekmanbacteria bacterium GWA2_38_9]OGL48682.1 MAG: MBL fold metallo-hydrolase [Candidatus Schekmanbacteria bacterium RIFCSPLOWO2_02_FULL_38_14]OGL49185.1 MAG: MBL fold metallo-hydrolase [Candidatus Schekmanbacteria bacterium RIFCSPHIGHO2_02_FULL_38_11]OGL54337.1 MAG: MBL fold metallo-hydrolase [Candidatus Schekmanbacteria bacterium RIFCSPLOWO2_12_FULL_38_15]
MEILFLGTGTSHGIPKIACRCDVCTSKNPKNKRNRSSAYLCLEDGFSILIDTSIDLRTQSLQYNIERVDAVFYTHYHADHIFGLDELRRFNELSGKTIPIYGSKETIDGIKSIFSYVFENNYIPGGGIPSLGTNVINSRFDINGVHFERLEGKHGIFEVSGFRTGKFAYFTDVNYISRRTLDKMKGLDVLVLGALRDTPHPTHFTIDEAVEIIEKVKPEKSYLTHISHEIDHEEISSVLPKNVFLAYDGLKLTV